VSTITPTTVRFKLVIDNVCIRYARFLSYEIVEEVLTLTTSTATSYRGPIAGAQIFTLGGVFCIEYFHVLIKIFRRLIGASSRGYGAVSAVHKVIVLLGGKQ
jgi:hypothetical protein